MLLCNSMGYNAVKCFKIWVKGWGTQPFVFLSTRAVLPCTEQDISGNGLFTRHTCRCTMGNHQCESARAQHVTQHQCNKFFGHRLEMKSIQRSDSNWGGSESYFLERNPEWDSFLLIPSSVWSHDIYLLSLLLVVVFLPPFILKAQCALSSMSLTWGEDLQEIGRG